MTDRARRLIQPAAVGVGAMFAVLALHVRDPHQQGSWGICPTAAIGFACPGCGGLRAVHDLSNADLGAAASSNLLLVLLAPAVVFGWLWWTRSRWRGHALTRPARARTPLLIAVAAVAIGFAVLRNLPIGAWLAP